jgi:hypothetical protein
VGVVQVFDQAVEPLAGQLVSVGVQLAHSLLGVPSGGYTSGVIRPEQPAHEKVDVPSSGVEAGIHH